MVCLIQNCSNLGISKKTSSLVADWFNPDCSVGWCLREHVFWCVSWPKVVRIAWNFQVSSVMPTFWDFDMMKSDMFPCHLFASIWPVKSVTCEALNHLPVPESCAMLRPGFGFFFWLLPFEFWTVLQVSFFVFILWFAWYLVVTAGAALSGRRSAVLLQYPGFTAATGLAGPHCVWSLVMVVTVFHEPADICCFDR